MSFDGVVLTVMAVLVGLFAGLARRGQLANLFARPVRAKALLVIGVAVPALADRFTREVAVPLVVIGLAALFAFAIVNVSMIGMSVMAIGILANLMATFLNGGLPVSRHALVAAGLTSRDEVDRVELSGARRLEAPTHRLRFLGDIIPFDETGQVLSFGDLVILIGLADITANLTLRKRKGTAAGTDDIREADESSGEPATSAPTTRRGPRPSPRMAAAPPPLDLDLDLAAPVVGDPAPPPPIVAPSPDVDWFTPSMSTSLIDPIPPVEPPAWLDAPAVVDEEPAAVPPDEPPAWLDAPAVVDDARPVPMVDLRDDAPPAQVVAPADADADTDALLRSLFADLTPRRRARRGRGPRNIPDFEPIHLDDELSLARR